MDKIVKRIYAIIICLLAISSVLIAIQFKYSNKLTLEHIDDEAFYKSSLFSERMDNWIKNKINTIEICNAFVSSNSDNKTTVLRFLENQMTLNSDFMSIYFGSKDNEFINASGLFHPMGLIFELGHGI